MRTAKGTRVLVATDGSPAAQAALTVAAKFPWGPSARVRAVVARDAWLSTRARSARAAVSRSFDAVAEAARTALAQRWRGAQVAVVDKPPIEAILSQAKQFGATVVVLGWRGHGTFARLLTGSVSRAIASRAERPVLVVRSAPRAVRRFVVGFDGSPNAERAVDFLCALAPEKASRAMLVNAVQPLPLPASLSRLPGEARAQVRKQSAALEDERRRDAEAVLEAALTRLRNCGWRAEGEVRTGAALDCLLAAGDEERADILVVGARGVTGIQRALLGSVANGALDRAPMPVLIVQ